MNQIVTFILVLTRVGGIFTAAPVFGNTHVIPMARIAIALSLAFVFFPMAHFSAAGLELLPFVMAVAKEAVVGLVMGFLVHMVLAVVQMAGAYIDLQVGFSFSSMVDPMSKEQNGIVGQFYNLAATLLFLAINGHHLVIRGLAESFAILPLGTMAPSVEITGGFSQLLAMMFVAAMKIGAPVAGAVFLTDLALSILARTVPNLNVFIVGMPAKIAVAFLAMIAVFPMSASVIIGLFGGIHRDLIVILKHFVSV